jgi:hypothetical protein
MGVHAALSAHVPSLVSARLLVWQDAHAVLHGQLLLLLAAEHCGVQLEANLQEHRQHTR